MDPRQNSLFNDVNTQSPQPMGRASYKRNSQLSANDVCAILDSCLRCSVKKISFDGLEVEFTSPQIVDVEAVQAGCLPLVESADRQGRRDGLAALGESVDDELEMLKITDPLLYEKFAAEQEDK